MSSQEHSELFAGDQPTVSPPPTISIKNRPPISFLKHKYRTIQRRMFWFTCLGLLLILLNVWSTIFSTPQAFAATVHAPVLLKGAPSKPNLISPTAGSTSSTHTYQPAPQGSAPTGTPQALSHNVPMAMKASYTDITSQQASQFYAGSDGRLDVTIPANAITAQDLSTGRRETSGPGHADCSFFPAPTQVGAVICPWGRTCFSSLMRMVS